MTVSIRPADVSDAEAVVELLIASELTANGLMEDAALILIAADDDGLSACGAIEMDGADGLLRSIAVAEKKRGEGLGFDIVNRLEREARERGITRLYLLTTTAEGFFERLGYEMLDRGLVPHVVRASAEFAACSSAGATAMVRTL